MCSNFLFAAAFSARSEKKVRSLKPELQPCGCCCRGWCVQRWRPQSPRQGLRTRRSCPRQLGRSGGCEAEAPPMPPLGEPQAAESLPPWRRPVPSPPPLGQQPAQLPPQHLPPQQLPPQQLPAASAATATATAAAATAAAAATVAVAAAAAATASGGHSTHHSTRCGTHCSFQELNLLSNLNLLNLKYHLLLSCGQAAPGQAPRLDLRHCKQCQTIAYYQDGVCVNPAARLGCIV